MNELNKYQEKAFETCTSSSFNLSYILFGLIAEVGELIEKHHFDGIATGQIEELIELCNFFGDYAKAIRKEEVPPINITTINEELAIKELGDIQWFISMFAKLKEVSLSEVAEINIKKLTDRQKRNKIIGEGDLR